MNKPDRIKEYLGEVLSQIRWKKAHEMISDELETHLEDQRAAFVREGQEADEATNNAIKEMGDATVLGTMLDRSYRPRVEWNVILIVVALFLLGRVMKVAFYPVEDINRFIIANLGYMGAELVTLLVAFFLDFTFYAKFAKLVWVALILFSFQWWFQDITFVLLPVASAALIFGLRNKGYGAIILAGILGMAVPALMFLFLNWGRLDLMDVWISLISTTAVLIICVCNNHFKVNRRKALLLICIPVCIATVLMVILSFYLSNLVYEHEWSASIRSMMEHANALGRGNEGALVNRELFLSDEFMLIKILYYVGWVPFIGVLATFLMLILFLYKKCIGQRSLLGKIIGVAAVTTISIQALYYIALNLGAPIHGWSNYASMPFVLIFGGSGILLGVLLSVFRTGDIVQDHKVRTVASR